MKKRVERSKVGCEQCFQIYGNWEREEKENEKAETNKDTVIVVVGS